MQRICLTTDTHWGYSEYGNGKNIEMLDSIKTLPDIDILIHCGDISSTTHIERKEYLELLRMKLGDLPIAVTRGNHDEWNKEFNSPEENNAHLHEQCKLYNIHFLDYEDGIDIGNLFIAGFGGWYANEVDTNDKKRIPHYRYPEGKLWLEKKASEGFNSCIDRIKLAKANGKTTILVTHFGFTEDAATKDWKSHSSAYGEPEYYGANLRWENYLENTDYLLFGHSHADYHGYAKNNTTKVINAGSNYEDPKFVVLEIE